MKNLIALALAALSTAQTVSKEVLNLAAGVRDEAAKAGEWLTEHEEALQAEHIRLTGSPLGTSLGGGLTESATLNSSGTAPLAPASDTLKSSDGSPVAAEPHLEDSTAVAAEATPQPTEPAK